MSKEELDQEELLVKDHNDIVRAIRARRAEKLQARNNAAAVAKIRAQACPICFASHAGECLWAADTQSSGRRVIPT